MQQPFISKLIKYLRGVPHTISFTSIRAIFMSGSIILLLLLFACCQSTKDGYVPELDIHYRKKSMKNDNYIPDDGRRIFRGKLFFSRTDTFETDYIDFNFTPVDCPKIYFVEPDTFYIIDRYGEINEIQNKEFKIVYVNHTEDRLHRYKEYQSEDSFLRAKSYTFELYDFANRVSVFDPQGNLIYQKNHTIF